MIDEKTGIHYPEPRLRERVWAASHGTIRSSSMYGLPWYDTLAAMAAGLQIAYDEIVGEGEFESQACKTLVRVMKAIEIERGR